jgi:hypothetical protein
MDFATWTDMTLSCVHFMCLQPAYGNAPHAHVSFQFTNAVKLSVHINTIYQPLHLRLVNVGMGVQCLELGNAS